MLQTTNTQKSNLKHKRKSATNHSPKGTLSTNTLLVSNVIFRNKIGSVTSFMITSLVVHGPGLFLAELVVAVGSIDLVVGELDR